MLMYKLQKLFPHVAHICTVQFTLTFKRASSELE